MVGIDIPRSETIYETLQNLGIDRASVVVFATFIGQFAHFQPIYTGDGLCFTFNSINSMEIYSDEYEMHYMLICLSLDKITVLIPPPLCM